MTKYVFMCRGIGEPTGAGMLMGNTGNIPGLRDHLRSDYRVVEVPWAADYGPVGDDGNPLGSSYAVNIQLGIIMIRDMLQALTENDTAILCGYSAGATLAGEYARLAGQDPYQMYGHRIAGLGLVADPMRPEFADGVPGFGIGGQRVFSLDIGPVYWAADPMDPITSLPANSPLRTIADQSYAMSFAPGEFPKWIGDLIDRLRTGRWQRIVIEWWNPIGVARQYADAIAAADRYLFRGDHTSYAIRKVPGMDITYLEWLAARLNQIHE